MSGDSTCTATLWANKEPPFLQDFQAKYTRIVQVRAYGTSGQSQKIGQGKFLQATLCWYGNTREYNGQVKQRVK